MSVFEPGSWVWINDEEERFLPAKVILAFQKGTATTVLTEDGEEQKLSPAQSLLVQECNIEALSPAIEDLVSISDLNEMSILHNLRIRYKQDKIYTNISSILISVNPFKQLPLYTPAVLDDYRNGYRGKAPHVFGIAYNAFHNMLDNNSDQSVVISGESGAGKSEATKLILQFLTDVSSRNEGGGSSTLEAQILAANPILEAFGNAKTLRNNNSSRFGKLITVNFDKNGIIIGGNIINYLLEKSRIVTQTQGERNYHIFYQLLSASKTNPTLTAELKLQDPELFSFTGQSGVIQIEGVSDEKDFEDIQHSMDILRFSTEEKREVFRIVAGVLYFGNLKYKVEKQANAEDGCSIINQDTLAHACKLWQVDIAMINKFLCARHIGVREIILVTYSIQQAYDARDAMVKKVYAELFQWIVDKINKELSATGVKRNKFIGVLDIFGFESFETNSFEQLCINYCNEKLQFHFNEHIFKMEQTLYAAEGITIPGSSFVDNQPTLDLLEARINGIFSMTDEEISVPKGSDDGLLTKILKNHVTHPNLVKPKVNQCKDFLKNFGVLHYAGVVFYNITNFLEKNKDQLHSDILACVRESSSSLLKRIFSEDNVALKKTVAPSGKNAPTKQKTLGGQFKNQLNDLIATLNYTSPHFVRCLKPNDEKIGNLFNASRIQDQLRYAGLVEVCRIRKLGYPVRRVFDEFLRRYRCFDLGASNIDQLVVHLSAKGILKEGEWAKGKTRLFMRTGQSAELELAREDALREVAIMVQKHARKFIMRAKAIRYVNIIKSIEAAIEQRDESVLTDVLDMSAELPWGGAHVGVVKNAKILLLRLKDEKRIVHLLKTAIASKELNSLRGALTAHASLQPVFQTPYVEEAEILIVKLENEAQVKKALVHATTTKNLEMLVEAIRQAQEIHLVCDEVKQAISVKERIEQENQLLNNLQKAVIAKDLALLSTYLNDCIELGLNGPEVTAAHDLKAKITAELASRAAEEERQRKAADEAAAKRAKILNDAKISLIQAKESKNLALLSSSIEHAMKLGLDTPELFEAQNLAASLKYIEDARNQLLAALRVLQVKSDSGVVANDLDALARAIANAEKLNVPIDQFSDLTYAKDAFSSFEKQIKAQADLISAVKSKDRKALALAVDTAENLDLTLDILTKAKGLLRDLEVARRTDVSAIAEEQEPYDAAEEARKKRQELAKQAKYDVKNYPGLRSADDYARGAILNKSKIKESFLHFQSNVIPKSLLDLNKENTKLALQIHKDLLGYMGDKQMPFPAMLAQDILRKGYEYKPIRDEIYLQVIKQLAGNPRAESIAKGWQIMCMCVGTFPPSYDFENYLLHFILEKRDKGRGAVVDYARYCLRTLEAMLSNGDGSGFVPSVEEILAYKDRPPILSTIHLVDGNVITEDLPITPDLNVGKVLEMCTGWLDLKDPRLNTLGMFVYDMGEVDDLKGDNNPYASAPYHDLPRTPRPLRNDEYMGDVIVQKARQRRKLKFVLKKKIYLPNHYACGDDPFYERMVYLQAEDEVIIQGNIDIEKESEVIALAAISMAVAFGEDMGASVPELVDAGVVDFISPSWRKRKAPEDWASALLGHRDDLVTLDAEQLQEQFLQIVQQSPQYGTHWFYVYKVDSTVNSQIPSAITLLPRSIILAFNCEGLHIYDTNRKYIMNYAYADIFRWGGSSGQFSLILSDETIGDSFEFVVITAQAADMAAIILDHIRAIMAEQGDGDN